MTERKLTEWSCDGVDCDTKEIVEAPIEPGHNKVMFPFRLDAHGSDMYAKVKLWSFTPSGTHLCIVCSTRLIAELDALVRRHVRGAGTG